MRTWVKVSLAGVALVVLAFMALAGTSAFFVMRHLDFRTATEAAALKEFEAIRSRFGERPHLIEVVDASKSDFRVRRPAQPDGRTISRLHVLTWTDEEQDLFRTELPVWLMRFSMINVASRLGVAPERFRITVQDLEHFGPGIVIDYRRPGVNRVLVWVN